MKYATRVLGLTVSLLSACSGSEEGESTETNAPSLEGDEISPEPADDGSELDLSGDGTTNLRVSACPLPFAFESEEAFGAEKFFGLALDRTYASGETVVFKSSSPLPPGKYSVYTNGAVCGMGKDRLSNTELSSAGELCVSVTIPIDAYDAEHDNLYVVALVDDLEDPGFELTESCL